LPKQFDKELFIETVFSYQILSIFAPSP